MHMAVRCPLRKHRGGSLPCPSATTFDSPCGAGTGIDTTSDSSDYARLVGRHESLAVELEIAGEAYAAARTAFEAARAEARRETRYIAAFIKPSVPERATAPNTPLILGMMAVFLTLSWALIMLVFYAVRDRR